jgi:hypothetical protein
LEEGGAFEFQGTGGNQREIDDEAGKPLIKKSQVRKV